MPVTSVSLVLRSLPKPHYGSREILFGRPGGQLRREERVESREERRGERERERGERERKREEREREREIESERGEERERERERERRERERERVYVGSCKNRGSETLYRLIPGWCVMYIFKMPKWGQPDSVLMGGVYIFVLMCHFQAKAKECCPTF